MGPKFGAQYGNKLGSQLGPMGITKLSPNWTCQMGPIHFLKFLLSAWVDRIVSANYSARCPSHYMVGHHPIMLRGSPAWKHTITQDIQATVGVQHETHIHTRGYTSSVGVQH